ncbi:MAG: DNA cytosine methyltransferase [Flavobacterium sp.]|uniref:DNA cytosine methyltransferase n=1 Tax=Flavobacterium sp. TaxID=239 RepID=UPI003BCE88DF
MSKDKLTIIDFFCGAGGFSEGFRQYGFEILLGVDHWQPAIDTFNHNFKKEFNTKNILDFSKSVDEIENLPDSDVIIGSPPCVSFSSSNKSGKADKSLGVQLTETFLRIVAVKKHKPDSKLKAWFMENVVNSKKHLQPSYTFNDLNLSSWARKNGINPNKIAIALEENSTIINSADFGSLQARKRLISGEIIKYNKFLLPVKTNKPSNMEGELPNYKTLRHLKDNFPNPFERKSTKLIHDPLYYFSIEKDKISDHFYDTGIYESDWQNSKYLKTNHPYMGKMSFPECLDNPSRTVTATKIANSRESLIFKTEINRIGNGEYRSPTIREAAIIMGFPITYQFLGKENTKWRLVGNAVCPSVSRALAKLVKNSIRSNSATPILVSEQPNLEGVLNLNNYSLKIFDKPPIKNKGSRFRRHPFKSGNMTIALSNFDIEKNDKQIDKWRVTAFYGTGEGFGIKSYKENYYKQLEPTILKHFSDGEKFIHVINNGFTEKIATTKLLQEMYEKQKSLNGFLEPTKLVEEVTKIVARFDKNNELFIQNGSKIFDKEVVPKKQLYALYALNKIISIANK